MADPTLVNGQITDAATQTNVKILGESPGQALGTVYQVMAHTVGIGMQNAVAAQQQQTTLSGATATQGINLLFTMDPASAAVSTQNLLTGNALASSLSELSASLASNQQIVKTAQSTPSASSNTIPGAGQPPQQPLQPAG
ncbi:MAG: RebB family R body protein [Acidobacteriota bacterium]